MQTRQKRRKKIAGPPATDQRPLTTQSSNVYEITLQPLPDELWLRILSFLPLRQRAVLACTCHAFYRLSRDPSLFRDVYLTPDDVPMDPFTNAIDYQPLLALLRSASPRVRSIHVADCGMKLAGWRDLVDRGEGSLEEFIVEDAQPPIRVLSCVASYNTLRVLRLRLPHLHDHRLFNNGLERMSAPLRVLELDGSIVFPAVFTRLHACAGESLVELAVPESTFAYRYESSQVCCGVISQFKHLTKFTVLDKICYMEGVMRLLSLIAQLPVLKQLEILPPSRVNTKPVKKLPQHPTLATLVVKHTTIASVQALMEFADMTFAGISHLYLQLKSTESLGINMDGTYACDVISGMASCLQNPSYFGKARLRTFHLSCAEPTLKHQLAPAHYDTFWTHAATPAEAFNLDSIIRASPGLEICTIRNLGPIAHVPWCFALKHAEWLSRLRTTERRALTW